MGFVKKVLEKEIYSNPIKYQRQCVTRKEFVDSMQHSMTLKVFFKYFKIKYILKLYFCFFIIFFL